jgi:glycosyltransferase involved in cell wall biosynthesis
MKINVVVTVYNHERYIAQCLESILKQKGDFQLEIIVGDDCSTDQTFNIIEGFRKSYPKIVNVLPVEQNLGIAKNLKRCLDACSGEYIAICEGDDYWTDENKLQKQKDFLDARRDCSMCFSAILLFYQEKNLTIPHHAQSMLRKDAITIEDLIENNYIGNFSCCMYRIDIVKKLPQEIYDLKTDDWLFNMMCSQFGKIGFIPDKMSVYRIHNNGAWSGKDRFEQLDYICKYIDISNKFFDYKYDALFRQRKKITEDRIVYLRTLADGQENEDDNFKGFLLKINLQMKNMVKKILLFLGIKYSR